MQGNVSPFSKEEGMLLYGHWLGMCLHLLLSLTVYVKNEEGVWLCFGASLCLLNFLNWLLCLLPVSQFVFKTVDKV